MQYAKPEKGEFMKKYGKLLPLFLAAPLLMSCGNGKVTKPEFADRGAEKTRTEFVEAVFDVSDKSAIAKEELLPSAVTKSTRAFKSVDEVLRENKVVDSTVWKENSEESRQIDMENVFTAYESKESTSYEVKDANTKTVSKQAVNKKQGFYEVKGSEKTYLVKADHNEKTYSLESTVLENKTSKEALDSKVRSILNEMAGSFTGIVENLANPFMPDEVFEGYKLYQNEKVFTIEYEKKIENDEYKVDDKVISVQNKETTKVWQVDMTDGKMAVKYYSHVTDKVEYKAAYNGHALGDITTSEEEEAKVSTYEYSSSIKAKKADISGYVALFEVK